MIKTIDSKKNDEVRRVRKLSQEDKMTNWLNQTSTRVGLIGLVITALQLYASGGDWVTIAIGALSGLSLIVRDGAAKGGGAVALLLGIGLATSACGGLGLPPCTTDGAERCDGQVAQQCVDGSWYADIDCSAVYPDAMRCSYDAGNAECVR